MNPALWILGYAGFGLCAVFIAGYSFIPDFPFDVRPLSAFIVGGPVWLITFPILYFAFRRRAPGSVMPYFASVFASCILTVLTSHLGCWIIDHDYMNPNHVLEGTAR